MKANNQRRTPQQPQNLIDGYNTMMEIGKKKKKILSCVDIIVKARLQSYKKINKKKKERILRIFTKYTREFY